MVARLDDAGGYLRIRCKFGAVAYSALLHSAHLAASHAKKSPD